MPDTKVVSSNEVSLSGGSELTLTCQVGVLSLWPEGVIQRHLAASGSESSPITAEDSTNTG